MTSPFSITKEHQLTTLITTTIATFWQSGHFEQFKGINDISIATARFIHPSAKQAIVISPGRAEGYLKYQELVFDLYNNGYSVFIIDHRGQGISQRMLADPHRGYVEDFELYATDLQYFINNIVAQHCSQPPLLLAHSMGSAIALRLMQRYPKLVKAAVLCSPMIAINGNGIPAWLAKLVILAGHRISQLFDSVPWYFFGQGPYKPHTFEDNNLSHSKIRHEIFAQLYQNMPALQIGGVTFQWLQQALAVNKNIIRDATKLATPLLVFQAGQDTIVSNQAQSEFCQLLAKKTPSVITCEQPIVIEGAKHELFFEQDCYRTATLTKALTWFEQFN
ncbi:alpha/beta fold hydrolase [Thalassotalea fusca]